MGILSYESKLQAGALKAFDAAAGTGTALFSTFYTIDLDNDYTTDTFLPSGVTVPILIAHQWSEIPVGKGKIRVTTEAGYVDFTLADTARGRELAEWLRFDMLDNQPKSEWSYGFTVKEGAARRETIEGKSVRVLSGVSGGPGCVVHEASYCLRGAGIGTALVAMKGEQRHTWARRLAELNALQRQRAQATQAEASALYQRFLERQEAIR